MKFLVFTKSLAGLSFAELAGLAESLGIDGYDLCVREGHHVRPDNVKEALPVAVEVLGGRGAVVGMLSLPPNFTDPDDPRARAVCEAMSRSGVPLVKIGYFPFQPGKHDFARSMQAAVSSLEKWSGLARAHGISVCYHTHANYLGSSAGVLARMLDDLDPNLVSAYLDPAQLMLQGEGLPVGMEVLKGKVAAIGLKDHMVVRGTLNNHGCSSSRWVQPGEGLVDWTSVGQAVARARFSGVVSAHVLMHQATPCDTREQVAREVGFYRQFFKEIPS